MRKIFGPVLICAAICSCKNNNTISADKNTDKIITVDNSKLTEEAKAVLGSFVGDFGDSRITVLITKATADSVEGSSIVGDNAQSFAGSLRNDSASTIVIAAKEPGTQTHEGIFNFTMNKARPDLLSGTWTPYKAEGNVKAKLFYLTRRTFTYRPDVGQYPQGSKRILKDDDLNNLMKPDLEQMRNEILARHGYAFAQSFTRIQFDSMDWYVPCTVNVQDSLTAIEKKNIVLIKKYEKYVQDYGTEFGR